MASRRRVAMSNVVVVEALAQAGRALAHEGIPVIALKGVALLGREYEDFGARPMTDFDILVPSDRMDDACTVMGRMGGRLRRHSGRPWTERNADARSYFHQVLGVKVLADLHCAFVPRSVYPIDYAELFDAAVAHPLPELRSVGVLRPAARHLLLHLAVHRLTSIYDGDTRNYRDAAHLLRCNDIDVAALSRELSAWGLSGVFQVFIDRGRALGELGPELAVLRGVPRVSRLRRTALRALLELGDPDPFRFRGSQRARQLQLLVALCDHPARIGRFALQYSMVRARDYIYQLASHS